MARLAPDKLTYAHYKALYLTHDEMNFFDLTPGTLLLRAGRWSS
jgi:hypothetical protein